MLIAISITLVCVGAGLSPCVGQPAPPPSVAADTLLVSVKAFGAQGDGVTNDRSAIVKALLSGSAIFFPKGTYVVGAPIDFGLLKSSTGIEVRTVVLVGEGPEISRIMFTGKGTLLTGGRTGPAGGGYNQSLNVRRLSIVGTDMGQPKISRKFGMFSTIPSEFAGTGSTQTAILWEFSAPSVIEQSEFRNFDTALRTVRGYGIAIRNNIFHYNNLAIDLSGAVTSVTAESNLIERNAIGVGLWIASQIRFRDNIFQGNYAGADIVSYNWNSQILFENNYFEASPHGFFHAGDSEGQYVSNNFVFRNNKGLEAEIGPLADRFVFEGNRLSAFRVDEASRQISVIANTDDRMDGMAPFTRYSGKGATSLIRPAEPFSK
jgi:hypothetical protein